MNDETITTDIPLAHRPKAAAPASAAAHAPSYAPVPGEPRAPPPTVGGFMAEGRALVDARKVHLSRVGIGPHEPEPARHEAANRIALPTQANFLAMPDLRETPTPPAINMATLPEKVTAGFEPRKLPKLAGVDTGAEE